MSIVSAVPIKENLLSFMVDGQSAASDQPNISVVTGDMTDSDGTFIDQPIGACTPGPSGFTAASFTQELFTPISTTLKPIVRTNHWVFTGMTGCGNMSNGTGNGISVSVTCH